MKPVRILMEIEDGIPNLIAADGQVEIVLLDRDVDDLYHPLVDLDPIENEPVFVYYFEADLVSSDDIDFNARFNLEGQSEALKGWILAETEGDE